MSELLIGLLSILFLIFLLLLRIHVGLALGIIGFVGLWLISGNFQIAMGLLITTPYNTVANFSLVVLPMFILLGSFAGHAGFAIAAYQAAQKWVGGLPGGLAIATTIANAAFGAVSGSSIAACAVFTKFSLPEMKRHGYQTNFACAAIAAAGLLAMLIPPSVLMIFYGIMTEQSIGVLFIAGVGPGLLLTALYSISIPVMVKMRPKLVGQRVITSVTWKDRIFSLREIWGIGVIVIIVIGGIYGGIFSPTEAGAAATFCVFLIGLALGKLKGKIILNALIEAAQTTAMIFFILIGATIYSKFLAVSGSTAAFVQFVLSSQWPPLAVLLAFMVLYIILGCLLDSISMMSITLPLVFPVAVSMGWNPIWFAMLVIMAIEIGLVTPPVGLNVYTVKAVAGPEVKMEDLFRAVFPFFILMLTALAILIAFPKISTWLPGLMFKK